MLSMIETVAMNKDVDVAKFEKIIDMQERIFDKNAEIAYNKAMAECQRALPAVVRDAVNSQTKSRYAKYESIIQQTRPVYTKYGFALSFYEMPAETADRIRVGCDVMHMEGHTKKFHIDMALDKTGISGNANKTDVHALGSSFSYAKRNLFCMVFNIQLADQDDDGVKGGGVTIESMLDHNALVRELFESIYCIKVALANEEWEQAAMAYLDLNETQVRGLWLAPTKGGMFTTEERKVMKEGKGFSEAVRALAQSRNPPEATA